MALEPRVTSLGIEVETQTTLKSRATSIGINIEYVDTRQKSKHSAYLEGIPSRSSKNAYTEGTPALPEPRITSISIGIEYASALSARVTAIGIQAEYIDNPNVSSSNSAYILGTDAHTAHAFADGYTHGATYVGITEYKCIADEGKVTLAVPEGTTENSIMIAALTFDMYLVGDNDPEGFTEPAGWTRLETASVYINRYYTIRLLIYYKIATGSEPESYEWSWSPTTFPNWYDCMGNIITVSDRLCEVVIGERNWQANTPATINNTAPGITTLNPDALVLHIGAAYSPRTRSDTDYTEIADEHTSESSESPTQAISYKVIPSTGEVPSYTPTWDSARKNVGYHIAIESPIPGYSTGIKHAYLEGNYNTSNNKSYLTGINIKTSSKHSYLKGYNTSTITKAAYMYGGIAVTSSQHAYCPGYIRSMTHSKHAFMDCSIRSRISAYIGEPIMVAQAYITLAESTGTTVCNFRVIHEGYTDGELEKAGSVEPTIGGGVDVSMGAIRRKWEPIIKVYGTNSTVDEAGFGTRQALEYFFSLNNPGGTPTNLITMTDHHGIGRGIFLIDTLQANLLTTFVEGSGAVFHVKVRMIEAN